jgi:RNA polymerase sigma-70 factor (ECF subfamily)
LSRASLFERIDISPIAKPKRYTRKVSTDIQPETIAAARAGSLVAFEQIMLAYEKAIYNHIYRMVSHKQVAEDITQETFLKAFRSVHTLDPEGNIRAFLYTVATNAVNDHLRKKYRKPEVYLIDDPERGLETLDPGDAYSSEAETVDANVDVTAALEKIKPVYRTVLLLFYRSDMSYEEISSSLKVPLGTVKTYIRRGKQALKEAIETP